MFHDVSVGNLLVVEDVLVRSVVHQSVSGLHPVCKTLPSCGILWEMKRYNLDRTVDEYSTDRFIAKFKQERSRSFMVILISIFNTCYRSFTIGLFESGSTGISGSSRHFCHDLTKEAKIQIHFKKQAELPLICWRHGE